MKVYQVKAPDGTIIKVRGPEGATQAEVIAQAQRLMANRQAPTSQAPQEAQPEAAALPAPAPEVPPIDYEQVAKDTANDMTGYEQFTAGMGGAVAGLGLGGRQILANMLEDEDWKKKLQEEAVEYKRLTGALNDTGAGLTGNIAGNVAMAALPGGIAGRAAGAGLPAIVATEAATGAGMGALAPTTEEGERTQNALIGGALGGAIPLAGGAARGLIGSADPAMQQAAGILGRYGIKVPKADQSPGAISKAANYVMENVPIASNISAAKSAAKNDKVRQALFKMLGSEVPESNDDMLNILMRKGEDIGNVTSGKTIPVADIGPGIQGVLKDYKVLGAQRNKHIMNQAGELMQLANMPGTKLKSEAYQAIRSQMATDARTATGQHQQALKGMIKVLDDEFGKVLSPEEAAKLSGAKAEYRLAKILSKVDAKEGQMDITKIRNAVEREAKRGPVMPAARELLDAADLAIPKVRPNGKLTPGLLGAGAMVMNPANTIGALGAGGAARAILNTGAPQKVVNSASIRKMTAAALRGAKQSYIEEE